MRRIIATIAASLLLALAGCENPAAAIAVRQANQTAEADGLPFRWESRNVDGGSMLTRVMIDIPSGPTRADLQLKQDALRLIGRAEAKEGRGAPELADVKPLKDGRELWILKSTNGGIAYVVTFVPDATGGTGVRVTGPIEFQSAKN